MQKYTSQMHKLFLWLNKDKYFGMWCDPDKYRRHITKTQFFYTKEESNVLICDVTHTNVEDPPQMHKIIIIVKQSQMFGYVI